MNVDLIDEVDSNAINLIDTVLINLAKLLNTIYSVSEKR